jgi:hypothetical protein
MRALSAALLTLVLLSGIIPFTALSSSHSCAMPCCAGVEGGCATGACQGALFKAPRKAPEEEKLCGAEDGAHGAVKKAQAADEAKDSVEADHCGSRKEGRASKETKSSASQPSESATEQRINIITARSLAAPCGQDCCAATSPGTQSRRGRDSTPASLSGPLPTPAFISLSLYFLNPPPKGNAHPGQLRARAPPRLFSHLIQP